MVKGISLNSESEIISPAQLQLILSPAIFSIVLLSTPDRALTDNFNIK
jgi:hypothetical protein